MKKVLILIAVLILSMGVYAAENDKSKIDIRDVSAVEGEKIIKDKNVIIVDIRTLEEYNGGFIKGALNIDFYKPDFKEKISKLDKNKTYFVYCRSGRRSGTAMSMFRELGFKTVYNLEKGILQWVGENRKLEVKSNENK